MLIDKKILVITVMVTACSSAQNNQPQDPDLKSTQTLCSQPNLISTSLKFLGALEEGDIGTAQSFYASQELAEGDDHGVAYTFFPESNDNAIFDFKQKNSESIFEIDVFGEYDDGLDKGQLVLFVQQQHKSKTRNGSFLVDRKFSDYFACYFQCIDDEWKITKYTCFEDSGGPFHPLDEDF